MSATFWIFMLATTLLEVALIAGAGYNVWLDATEAERAAIITLSHHFDGVAVMVVLGLLLATALAIAVLCHWYVAPLNGIAEETQLVALTNPRYRLSRSGRPEMQQVVDSINLLADRFQRLQDDFDTRIREAGAALEEERDTLAALMSKISQGVIVCSLEGRVMLYNSEAQRLLEGPARGTGAGDWIGLGRSIYSVLDEGLIRHALMTLVHGRHRGEMPQLVPFTANRPGGQLLNVHLVPISGKSRQWHGYILTFDDATRRVAQEMRRITGLRNLIERQRTAITSIRAAIEAIMTYEDMDEDGRRAFEKMILDETVHLSHRFEGIEDELAQDLATGPIGQEALASDLLAAIERHAEGVLGVKCEVRVPIEPIRLKIEAYAVARCLIFLIGRVRERCRAENFSLTLEEGSNLCAVVLAWSGDPVTAETLNAWGTSNVFTDIAGASRTLNQCIEQHSGTIWPLPAGKDDRPSVRLLLPTSGGPAPQTVAAGAELAAGEDFDFRLSRSTAGHADPLNAPLRALSFTVFDTETTGLFPERGDEIISMAAIRIVGGRILRREIFDCLVNPQRPIPPESIEIHGISPGMVRSAPTIAEVLPRFARFVEDTVLIGHNVAFDLRFLARKEETTGIRLKNRVLDTFYLERAVHPNQIDKRLEATASRLGIALTGRHTALGDALTTAEVFLALLPVLAEKGIVTLRQAIEACGPDLDPRLKA